MDEDKKDTPTTSRKLANLPVLKPRATLARYKPKVPRTIARTAGLTRRRTYKRRTYRRAPRRTYYRRRRW